MRDRHGHTHLGTGKTTKLLFAKKGIGAERIAKSKCNCNARLLNATFFFPSIISVAGTGISTATAIGRKDSNTERSILHSCTAFHQPKSVQQHCSRLVSPCVCVCVCVCVVY